jgi:hypothetical protein
MLALFSHSRDRWEQGDSYSRRTSNYDSLLTTNKYLTSLSSSDRIIPDVHYPWFNPTLGSHSRFYIMAEGTHSETVQDKLFFASRGTTQPSFQCSSLASFPYKIASIHFPVCCRCLTELTLISEYRVGQLEWSGFCRKLCDSTEEMGLGYASSCPYIKCPYWSVNVLSVCGTLVGR